MLIPTPVILEESPGELMTFEGVCAVWKVSAFSKNHDQVVPSGARGGLMGKYLSTDSRLRRTDWLRAVRDPDAEEREAFEPRIVDIDRRSSLGTAVPAVWRPAPIVCCCAIDSHRLMLSVCY